MSNAVSGIAIVTKLPNRTPLLLTCWLAANAAQSNHTTVIMEYAACQKVWSDMQHDP